MLPAQEAVGRAEGRFGCAERYSQARQRVKAQTHTPIELRRGNAGANTAADQNRVLDRAVAQLPELPDELHLLVRADTAGAVHDLVGHIRGHVHARFSVGMPFKPAVRTAIHNLAADDGRWVDAVTQQGTARKGTAVAEIIDLVDLTARPKGSRLLVRREPLHPGAQQTFDDIAGFRLTAFLTAQPDTDIALLDARHRAHARVEDRIRCAKNTGLAAMPLDTFDRNQLWCHLVAIAADLLTFTQQLALRGTHRTAQPKVLRYQLLHVAVDGSCTPDGSACSASKPTGPGSTSSSPRSDDSGHYPPAPADRAPTDALRDTISQTTTTLTTSRPPLPRNSPYKPTWTRPRPRTPPPDPSASIQPPNPSPMKHRG